MSRGHCEKCGGPCRMPRWVIDAGGINYPNNPDRQQMAIANWHRPVTTPRERAAARAFLEASPRLAELTARIRAQAGAR